MEILKIKYDKCNLICNVKYKDTKYYIREYQKISSYIGNDEKKNKIIVDTMILSKNYISEKINKLMDESKKVSFINFYLWEDKIGFTLKISRISRGKYHYEDTERIYCARRDIYLKELRNNIDLFDEINLNNILVEYL